MSEFMLMYKGGDPDWKKNATPEEMAATMEKWGAWMENLKKTDQLVTGGAPLEYSGQHLTKEGVVTDLATSELKELVTGYSIIKAEDIAGAIVIAKECPIFSYPGASLDVREIMQMG